MKRFVFFVVAACVAASLFAQVHLPEHQFAAGNWGFVGSRLYQNDVRAGLAKMNLRAPQSGPMIYEFNVRYEDGLQDGHGGFGLHVLVDTAYNGPSWGAGNSYLFWLNYDEAPVGGDIPRGFSAQVYKSRGNSVMDLVESYDLNQYLYLVTNEVLANPIPAKIWVDGNTGEVRIYDPSDPELLYYFYFYLDRGSLPLKGEWVVLRTNGVKLSFGMDL